MSHLTRLKVLYAIGRHTNDVELGDRLWKVVKTNYPLQYSNRLLAAGSNETIIREMTANKAVIITDAQLCRILQKRFDSGVELLQKLFALKKEKRLEQKINSDNAIRFVLLKNFEKGFNILIETEVNMSLGANRTRYLFKALAVSGDSTCSQHIVKYSRRMHQATLRRYAPRDFYLQCFIENNYEFMLESDDSDDSVSDSTLESDIDVESVMGWIAGFDNAEKRRFLEALYQKRYGKSMMEVPTQMSPEMLHVLSEEERTQIIEEGLRHGDLSSATTSSHKEHFWRAMRSCAQSSPDLKNQLENEQAAKIRAVIYELMILSPLFLRDKKALKIQLRYVVGRCRNETPPVRDAILSAIERCLSLKDRFKVKVWKPIKEFYEALVLNRYTSHWAFFDILFLALTLFDPKDTAGLEEVAALIGKAQIAHTEQ